VVDAGVGRQMTALEQLGRFVAGVGREPLADRVRELVELHLVDTVAAWVAGAATAEGRAMLRYRVAMVAGGHNTTAVDLGTRCTLARLSEVDDIHLPSMTTPGGIVVPAALTLAEPIPTATAGDVIAAILAGYEAMTRLGSALNGPTILYRGIWPTYFAAPFGVAAAAARLHKLNEEQTANALALALTFAAPGVGHHNAPTTARWLSVGNAARNGLAAVLAAQQGFTSDLKLIEGNFFSGIYGVTPDVAALTDGLGEGTVLQEVSFKPWCAARQTMAATQALKEIIEGGVAPESITEVQAFVLPPHLKMIDHSVVAGDRASHLTSLPYCMAVAAVAPELAFDVQQSPTELSSAARGFMSKIKVAADDGLLAEYPRAWPARMRVVASSGTHERTVTHVPGDPARTLGAADIMAKCVRFTAATLGVDKAEGIFKRCGQAIASREFSSLAAEIEQATR
jgi:2-methylcitrate dehydratase PrpD